MPVRHADRVCDGSCVWSKRVTDIVSTALVRTGHLQIGEIVHRMLADRYKDLLEPFGPELIKRGEPR